AADVVVVGPLVAGRGDEDLPGVAGVGHGVVQGRGRAAAAPAVVTNLGAVLDRVVDGLDRGVQVAAAVGPHELDRHDGRLPGHADDAAAVVADGPDGAGDVRPVDVVVHGVVVVVGEVPADQVVLVAVVVVIDPVLPAAAVVEQVAAVDAAV